MRICGETLVKEFGELRLDGSNIVCRWRIIAAFGEFIVLNVSTLDLPSPKRDCASERDNYLIVRDGHYIGSPILDCIYDRLEIYDGTVVESTALLSKLCGQIVTKTLVSHFNTALLLFISDSSVQKEGFHINFVKEINECKSDSHGCEHRCVNKIGGYECKCNIGYSLRSDGKTCQSTCGGIIKASNGTFHSPNYPLNYAPLKTCIWQIEANNEYQIIVNFTHFDVEGMKSACSYDYVLIQSDEGMEERYCGYYNSLVYTSATNRIKVLFVSDNTIEKNGFLAYFITDLNECRNNNGGCQQRCTNTIGSYQCECENGYVLADDGHNCKEGDCNLQVYDPEGEITSPNYPFNYPQGKNCNWHFVTTPGHRLSLSFEEFMFEEHNACKYDHIEIFDGGNSDATSLGIFCVCGGNLKAEQTIGFIYSHARYSDGKYEKKMRCEWRIVAESNRGVNIRFAQFDLEREANCEFDYVEIYDGYEILEEYRVARYCGDKLPSSFTSTGRSLLLLLITDESEEQKGFIVEYRSSIPGTIAPFTSTTRRPPREPIINNN
uniref:BMA-NAS-39, isoform c n=1 Tax=Brugia malayi TaxID=6279 RepID=A0A1I9G096_BRUMA|nr:BMA-NAS-39, isoform c [Brugia malayi]